MKLLDQFPRPLLADIRSGAWVPIVGAGLSRNAVLPNGGSMPTWKELGALLAADVTAYSWDGDAVDAISAFAHEHGRNRLLSTLADLLHIGDAEPGRAHEAFCRLDMKSVITTNFDFLLDEQYRRLGKPCLPIVEEQQLALSNPHSGPTLIKLHGDLHHPNEVTATEEDYDRILRAKPLMATALASQLIGRTGLLIGYSLSDPDVRQILALLSERLGASRRPVYALLVQPSPVEVTRFHRRGITPVSLPLIGSHGETLATLFDEIRAAMEDEVARSALGSTVESTVNLRLPRSVSRLVYFSAAPRDVPLYRSLVFPELARMGAVPVTADDITTEPGTERAKPAAVLQRAVAAVVDLSTEQGPYEFRLAQSAEVPNIIGVIPSGREMGRVPSDLRDLQYISAPGDDDEESWRGFASRIADSLGFLWQRSDLMLIEETDTLVRERRWLPALLTSTSMLEAVLRSRLDVGLNTDRRPVPLRELLRMAERQEVVKPRDVAAILTLAQLRNKVAHGVTVEVDEGEAEPLLRNALRVARRIMES